MRSFPRRFLVIAVESLIALAAAGQTAVPRWQQLFRPATQGTSTAGPIAARELADGTRMVVNADGVVAQYAPSGAVLGSIQLPMAPARVSSPSRARSVPSDASPFITSAADIDPFGHVVVSRSVNASPDGFSGDTLTMKFDGFTGQPEWAQPAVFDAGYLSGEYPLSVALDPGGDVVVSGISAYTTYFTLKYSGVTGSTIWGPLTQNDIIAEQVRTAIGTNGNVFTAVTRYSPVTATYDIDVSALAAATGTPIWSVTYDGGGVDDRVGAAWVDGSGDLLVAGETNGGFLAIRYDPQTGNARWQTRTYSGPSQSEARATTIMSDLAGNVFLAGWTGPFVLRNVVQKLSGADGTPVWNWISDDDGLNEPGARLSLAGNGDAILDAQYGIGGVLQRHLRRFRGSDGEMEWDSGVLSDGTIAPAFSFLLSNGNVFAAARTEKGLRANELYGLSGSIVGSTLLTPPETGQALFRDLAVGPDGGVVAIGDRTDLRAILVLKYDGATGAVLWGPIETTRSQTLLSASRVLIDNSDNAIIVSSDADGTVFVEQRLGSTGEAGWSLALTGLSAAPVDAALDAVGNVFVLLMTFDQNAGRDHAFTFKVAAGTPVVAWGKSYVSDPAVWDYPEALAITPAGDPVIFGSSQTNQSPNDWFLVKYSGADGSSPWGGACYSNGFPFALTSDPAGNLVVTGLGVEGITTLKFDGVTGAPVWGPKTFPGPNAFGFGKAVLTDAAGDVFVAGDVGTTPDVSDLTIIKYASANGAVLWGPKSFDGESHSADRVSRHGLGLDAEGNVVLGGTARSAVHFDDVAVLKYDGVSGDVLWGPVFAGGAGTEVLGSLAVQGGRVVAGAPSEGAFLIQSWDEGFGILTQPGALAPAMCGMDESVPFEAANGNATYSWSVSVGNLPQGTSLSTDGILSGTPSETGQFAFRARVQDSTAATAEADFTLFVQTPPAAVPIQVGTNASCQTMLSVAEPASDYLWFPGGETTASIVVQPATATTYGVRLADASGCFLYGSVTVPGRILFDPGCGLAPGILSVAPMSGPAAGGTSLTLVGQHFDASAEVHVGGVPAPNATASDPEHATADTPALSPGSLNSVTIINPNSSSASIVAGFLADFEDVDAGNVFHDFIALLVKNGVTAGCGGGDYCPAAPVSRAQMAVFLLKSRFGANHAPPPPTGVFVDVPLDSPFAPWIEELASLGVTAGCGGNNYCPAAAVTRAQMAVFLLKARNGPAYVPPPATGIFDDVPASDPFAPWIEQIHAEGITAGCSSSPPLYCPASSVNRGQMAAFLVKTFSLVW